MCEIKNSSFSANVSEVLIFARCENLLACVSIFGKNVFTGKLTLCQQPVSYQNFDTRYAKANTRHEHLQAFTNDRTYGLNIILVFCQTCMV